MNPTTTPTVDGAALRTAVLNVRAGAEKIVALAGLDDVHTPPCAPPPAATHPDASTAHVAPQSPGSGVDCCPHAGHVHDRLLAAGDDLDALAFLIEVAVTWGEIDYGDTAEPAHWLEVLAAHDNVPNRATLTRIVRMLASDVAGRAR